MMKFGANAVTQAALKGSNWQLRSCFEFEIYLSGFAILFIFGGRGMGWGGLGDDSRLTRSVADERSYGGRT